MKIDFSINLFSLHRYIEGHTLYEAFLFSQGFNEAQVCNLVKQVIQGLSILHRNQLYHSDIKPQNIVLPKQNLLSQSLQN